MNLAQNFLVETECRTMVLIMDAVNYIIDKHNPSWLCLSVLGVNGEIDESECHTEKTDHYI